MKKQVLTLVVAAMFVRTGAPAARDAQTPAPQSPVQGAPSPAQGRGAAPGRGGFNAEPQTIPLWEGGAPGALGTEDADRPTITVYRAGGAGSGTGVVIAPGGAYAALSMNNEGRQEAYWFNAMGVTAFVLEYRLGPRYHHPIQLGDAQRAIRIARARASEFGILPDRIGMMGFSAGGHLTATAGTRYDEGKADAADPIERVASRPDFLILAYPAAPRQSAKPQQAQVPQESVFRTGARTVSVYATVRDAGGRLVPDLTRDDFEIYDNGKRQAITLFESGLQPITLVMMLDRSGSMIGNFNLVRSAAEQFVAQLLSGDKVRIGSFANRIQLDPRDFTSNTRDLIAILRIELQEPGPTPLWNAVNVAITALQHQEGRRVVLVFTDGVDRPPGSNNISLRDAMKHAEEEDVMVFAIGLEGRVGFGGRGRRGGRPGGELGGGFGGVFGPPPPPETTKPDPGLPRIAMATGGGYFELTSANNISATFTRIADELHRQYALAFTPATFDGKTHKLEVRLRRPDLTVRARRSYFARKDM